MKWTALVVFLGLNLSSLSAQALVEHAVAAGGGAVGGVAGKKVSDAVSNIFDKVDKTTSKAASAAEKSGSANEPLFEVGPGVPHSEGEPSAKSGRSSVPPPPPVARHNRRAVRTEAERAPAPAPAPVAITAPPPPPPPQATADDLRKIAVGTSRADVLKLGFPAIHISMYDDGHLVETFRYVNNTSDVGAVHLTDGSVSSVQVN
jgi:hypothetical protein